MIFGCRESTEKNFVGQRNVVRKQTDKACRQFHEEVKQLDWNSILKDDGSPDNLVKAFKDTLFPLVSVRKRSNELPWITQGIRKLARKKKRVYKREGKSLLWANAQARADYLIEASKEKFANESENGGPRSYFNAVQLLATNGKRPDWDVRDLFQGLSADEVGDRITDYFSRISNEYRPLDAVESLNLAPRSPLTDEEVVKLLKNAKKPNLMVKGDVLPRLMKLCYRALASPVKTILNSVFRSGRDDGDHTKNIEPCLAIGMQKHQQYPFSFKGPGDGAFGGCKEGDST